MAHRNYKVRGTPDCPIAVYSTSKLVRLSHWHPEVELLLVTCGTIHCRLGDRDLPLTTGDILIINPNQAHSFLSFSEDHRYINVFFSTEAIAMPESHIFQRLFLGEFRHHNHAMIGGVAASTKNVVNILLGQRKSEGCKDRTLRFFNTMDLFCFRRDGHAAIQETQL